MLVAILEYLSYHSHSFSYYPILAVIPFFMSCFASMITLLSNVILRILHICTILFTIFKGFDDFALLNSLYEYTT